MLKSKKVTTYQYDLKHSNIAIRFDKCIYIDLQCLVLLGHTKQLYIFDIFCYLIKLQITISSKKCRRSHSFRAVLDNFLDPNSVCRLSLKVAGH